MTKAELVELIKRKKSFLCVGLDTDPEKLPESLKDDPDGVFEFNKAIIESTLPFAVSYKLNIAFYEAMGIEGWDILQRTIDLIPPREALIIADAKRGDIGNTAARYGKAFFETLNCDAITVNPYMGEDSITPFLGYEGKWSIVLGLTSNVGAQDIELLKLEDGRYVFEAAMEATAKLGSSEQIMFVVGATQTEYLERIRKVAPDHFLLIPGVGAQGGQLTDLKMLLTPEIGILVNSSRQIIYASSGEDFAEASAIEAEKLQVLMSAMLT
jgi:orotidine-5'-phosphate decarboxylase